MSVVRAESVTVSRETAARYAEWLRRSAADPGFDPYYSEEVLRFELRGRDALMAAPDVSVAPASCGVALASARTGATLTVCGITSGDARAILGAIDGVRSVTAARAATRVPPGAWDIFLRETFGKVVFAPAPLARLEARVSFTEIVRFPGSPYEVVRSYWENMAEVTERLASFDAVTDVPALVALLRELNALALVGSSGQSFYRPASPVATKGELEPGALWATPSITEETSAGTRFVSGPRVNAAPIGGERYQALLARSVDDVASLEGERALTDEDGLPWGRVVTAKSDADAAPAPWFCPPRPLEDGHFAALLRAISAALAAGSQGDVVRHAAAVHFSLVRLHPFVSGNQSIAMALVNRLLRPVLGAGIPHLVLDHLALRLALPAYERVFARAVAAWLSGDESPVRRALELSGRRRKVFAFLQKLGAGPGAASEDAVAAVVASDRDGARLALLDPDGHRES